MEKWTKTIVRIVSFRPVIERICPESCNGLNSFVFVIPTGCLSLRKNGLLHVPKIGILHATIIGLYSICWFFLWLPLHIWEELCLKFNYLDNKKIGKLRKLKLSPFATKYSIVHFFWKGNGILLISNNSVKFSIGSNCTEGWKKLYTLNPDPRLRRW